MNDRFEEFAKALEHFQHELATIRTGRATPALLEDIRVEYYGTPTPLNQLASINAPEPMMLTVQVWDVSVLQAVEKAICTSSMGLNPNVDGQLIRVPLPSLTEERRQELVKLAKQKAEAARVSIRTIREESMRVIKNAETEKEISEDIAEAQRKELQKIVDEQNERIRSLLEKKQEEILKL